MLNNVLFFLPLDIDSFVTCVHIWKIGSSTKFRLKLYFLKVWTTELIAAHLKFAIIKAIC